MTNARKDRSHLRSDVIDSALPLLTMGQDKQIKGVMACVYGYTRFF